MVSASRDLIRTVPLVARGTHALQVASTSAIAERFALSAHVLGLALSDDGAAHWLRYVVWRHGGVLLDRTIVAEVHLVDVVDSTFSHLVLRCDRHLTFVISSVWLLAGHLLIKEVSHFIVMH